MISHFLSYPADEMQNRSGHYHKYYCWLIVYVFYSLGFWYYRHLKRCILNIRCNKPNFVEELIPEEPLGRWGII